MKKFFMGVILTLFATITGLATAEQKTLLSIGTGGTGGVYYPLGGGMASILSKYVPGYAATAEVTGGSVANLQLLGAGRVELGFSMTDASWDAYVGAEKFKNNKLAIRTLRVLYPSPMHVVTIEGTGINKMSDLKGKRVSTGSPGAAAEQMAFRLFEFYGIDKDKDIVREKLSVAESVNAIKDKKIDAFFWNGGVPTAAVTDLAATPGIKLKLIDHAEAVDAMNKKYGPLYTKGVIPAKAYPRLEKDNHNATVWNILVANASMSDEMAYNIVKTLFEHRAELIAVHREAENMTLENQNNSATPIPYHPGAIKYFAEKGIKLK